MKKKVLYYLNQFFGQIGGEEKAGYKPTFSNEKIGPCLPFSEKLENAEVIGTIICGDNYFNENKEESLSFIDSIFDKNEVDILIVGPSFNAGRYGMACAEITNHVAEKYNIPVVGGCYKENPGLDMAKLNSYIVETKDSAADMRKAIAKMAKVTNKIIKGEELDPKTDEYFMQGKRKTILVDKIASERAVEMLINRLNGKPFKTELPMPTFDNVEPGKAIEDLSKATIALVTSGGIVPMGNPDKIQSASARIWGKYSVEGRDNLENDFCTIHGGYDPVYANEKPDRVLPLDLLRKLEKENVIGKVYKNYYATTGTGTAVGNAIKFGKEIGKELYDAGVDGVIVTSTWGTCTRCGATMVKEIERFGIPVVHMATITTISKSVGANRIVPTIAIPHPVGNPSVSESREYELRKALVDKAMKAFTTKVDEPTIF